MNNQIKPSVQDLKALKRIRKNVDSFLLKIAEKHDSKDNIILDIAPQVYEGAAAVFKNATVETLDIEAKSRPTYVADITKNNSEQIPNNHFDVVICTEVIEHTLNPFSAAEELYRITKTGGHVYVSIPFNFRIHGPLPDCWRITEHGLRILFKDFSVVDIEEIPTSDRPLMPLHYTVSLNK